VINENALLYLVWVLGTLIYYHIIVDWVRKDRNFKVNDLIIAPLLSLFWPVILLSFMIEKVDRVAELFGPVVNAFAARVISFGGWVDARLPDPNAILLPKRGKDGS
jgi:ABC-type thiamin/hydroxymethylpyrimidine transport system permease subunit